VKKILEKSEAKKTAVTITLKSGATVEGICVRVQGEHSVDVKRTTLNQTCTIHISEIAMIDHPFGCEY
jgi:ribosomal protein L24